MTGIEGKVVAITGASSGIGEATALLLAERGAAVALGARRIERLDELARGIRERNGRAVTWSTDVTRREDLERLVGRAVEEFGRLDVLVSNAGISKIGPMSGLDVDGWLAMIDVNLCGVLHGIAAALPVFRRQGQGHLVTTVSTAGLKIVPTQAVYAATKNAVRTLLEGLRQESTAAWTSSPSRRKPSPAPSHSPSNNHTTSRSATSLSAQPSRPSRRFPIPLRNPR